MRMMWTGLVPSRRTSFLRGQTSQHPAEGESPLHNDCFIKCQEFSTTVIARGESRFPGKLSPSRPSTPTVASRNTGSREHGKPCNLSPTPRDTQGYKLVVPLVSAPSVQTVVSRSGSRFKKIQDASSGRKQTPRLCKTTWQRGGTQLCESVQDQRGAIEICGRFDVIASQPFLSPARDRGKPLICRHIVSKDMLLL